MDQIKSIVLKSNIILFDVDDTLLYTFKNGFYKINAAAKECGYSPVSYNMYKLCYGQFTFQECLHIWFPFGNEIELSEAYDLQKSKFPYKPICNFGRLQDKLYSHGIRCGILTNGKRNAKLYEKLCCVESDFTQLIGIWGREDLPFTKPDSRALLPIKKLYPRSCITYFGDSYSDYQMCLEGNIQFVQVLSGKEKKIQESLSIRDVSVLLEYL